jgi:poly(ADP-ribose) glycohydrolase
MAKIALELPELMEGKSLHLLKKGVNGHHKLTKQQVASLLANAFFCTFPRRNNPHGQFENYPTINFNG